MKRVKNFLSVKALGIFSIFLLILLNYNQNNPATKETRLLQRCEESVESGEILRKNGKFIRAIEVYRDALKISRKIEKKDIQVQSLIILGLLYWNEGKIKKSFDYYREALAVAEEMNLEEKKKEILDCIEIYKLYREGKEFRSQGKHKKSIESFNKAIALARKIRSEEHEVKCLRQQSIAYLELSDLNNFFSLNKQALEIARRLNHRKEEGRCLNNIGIYYERLDNYSQALNHYEDALKIAHNLKNIEDESDCLNNISNIYGYMGNYEKALEYMNKVLKIDQQLRNNFYINLNNIGDIYRSRGLLSNNKDDLYKALEYFRDCLELARKNEYIEIEILALNNIGTVYTDLENYPEALKYLKQGLKKAEEIQDIETTGMLLNNTGIVHYNQGNYEMSIKYYQKAIDLALRIEGGKILWEAYFELGRCYEKKNEFSLALTYYKKAIDIIDEIRSNIFFDTDKAGFVRDKLKVYESLLNLLYHLHQKNPNGGFNKEIFYQVEKAKARAFLESLGERKIDIREWLTPEFKEREREVSRQISQILLNLRNPNISEKKRNDLLKKLEEKEDEYLRLLFRMRGEVPQFANLIYPDSVRLENIQSQFLDEKTAFIEYFLGEEKSFLFLITKYDFDLYTLPPREEIEESIKAYLRILSTPEKGKFRGIQASRRLYGELLFPLEKVLPERIENLVIIPDGTLYYLPFETLTKENEFLIKRYKISYAPSSSALTILFEKKDKIERPKSILAFGNPVYTLKDFSKSKIFKTDVDVLRELYISQGFDFSPLPYSEREILEISNFFPEEKSDIYLKSEAREEVVKRVSLKDYQIIHFACHGFLDEKLSFRSALVLTLDNDPREDGFLQVREIYTLRFNADLVVLSACQTGKGLLERGEGILGLPRIFFYAGAKSVLTTLWKVNDKSTSEFMAYFYQNLSQGKDKAQALRLAKLKMLDSLYAHPFYWAAFVLNGDYNSNIGFR